ncbi:MAG: response regulator [Variibacter sp.]|nr:response regulator [Variibacter sp.]
MPTRPSRPVRKRAPPVRRAQRGGGERDASSRSIQAALAGLAHEVRTPLNGILVLAELLASSALPERERAWAQALKGAADHLAQLTTVVVDGARAGFAKLAPRREAFDLQALAAALSQSLAARAGVKGLVAETVGREALPRMVVGDPVLLRAAAENLLDNAVKFTGSGAVSLRFAIDQPAAGPAQLRLSISDQGIGMTAAELRRLFRPFAQANTRIAQRFRGAGLGLAFARQVARAMGGDLTAVSRPGEGTTFELSACVERVEEDGAALDQRARPHAAPSASLRILCAEDNPYGRVMFNTMLTTLGHRVDFVASGEAAVAAASQGTYDLVLMDVTLAGMDGVQATRRIRAAAGAAGRIPIIGITGRGDAKEEQTALAAGMDDYLIKPISPSVLVAALARVT